MYRYTCNRLIFTRKSYAIETNYKKQQFRKEKQNLKKLQKKLN